MKFFFYFFIILKFKLFPFLSTIFMLESEHHVVPSDDLGVRNAIRTRIIFSHQKREIKMNGFEPWSLGGQRGR